jgi:hypothetical protein
VCEIPGQGSPRSLRRDPTRTRFWLPDLTPEKACPLTKFLDGIQEGIWMDYGLEIVAYLDRKKGTG